MKRFALSAVAVLALTTPAAAQFVSQSSSAETPVCPSRPPEPPIVENMDVRDAHRATLIQRMYTASSFTVIAQNDECACDTRFPSWQPAVEYYLEHYAMIEDRHEIYARERHYSGIVNDLREEVRAICSEQGNW